MLLRTVSLPPAHQLNNFSILIPPLDPASQDTSNIRKRPGSPSGPAVGDHKIQKTAGEREDESQKKLRMYVEGLPGNKFGWPVIELPIRSLNLQSHDTPTGRSVAEPPMFNYDALVRNTIPSDERFRLLFPKRQDVEKMTEFKDLYIEWCTLNLYRAWAREMTQSRQLHSTLEFYMELRRNVISDEEALMYGWASCLDETNEPGTLVWWEFTFLDNDLRTTRIEKSLAMKYDWIFSGSPAYPQEAREKYQHLFPEGASDRYKTVFKRQLEYDDAGGKEWQEKRKSWEADQEKIDPAQWITTRPAHIGRSTTTRIRAMLAALNFIRGTDVEP